MPGPVDSRLLKRARATRVYLAAGLAVGLATAVLAIAQAWLLSSGVVNAWHLRRAPGVGLLLLLALVFAGRAGLAWLNQTIAVRSSAAVKSQLRDDIVSARLRDPLSATTSSEQVTILTKGLDALDGYFAKYLPQLGLAATVPIIIGVVVLFVDWQSAIIMGLTVMLIPLFMALIGWLTADRMRRRWSVQTRLAQHFSDLIAGLPTLQAFGRARAQIKGLEITEEENRKETMSTLTLSFMSSFALEFISMLSVAGIAVWIGLRLVDGRIGLLPGLFVLVLAPDFYTPIRMVGVHYHDSADGVAASEAAFQIIDAADSHPVGTRQVSSLAEQPLVLDHVGHTYDGTDRPALHDLSLTVNPGEVVALVGPSGGGKSTAIAAVMGFIRPSEGTIRIGDVSSVDADPESWRAQIAYVSQRPGMIAGTVADNVALGLPPEMRADPDPVLIADALHRAGDAGLQPGHAVGDDGRALSGGERRRVALARALLRVDHGANLLILDEPTAGLDAAAETNALQAIRALNASGRRVGALVVTHRPAVIAAADRVVRIEAAA